MRSDFERLWAAQSLSLVGSSVTAFALPVLAIGVLHASAFQMGLLIAAESLPAVLVSLFAGVWTDRLRRRRMMIFADVARALVLLVIPICGLAGWLSVPLLIAVAFCVGSLTIWFDTASISYLPSIVSRQQLLAANGKLTVSFAVAEITGPALGGALVQMLGNAYAIGVNVVTFLLSGALLQSIRTAEPAPAVKATSAPAYREAWQAMIYLWEDGLLRSLTLRLAAWHFIVAAVQALAMLYGIRHLKLSPAVLGFLISLSGLGCLIGAIAAPRLGRHVGPGPSIIGAILAAALASLLIPIAQGPLWVVAPMLGVCTVIFGAGVTVYSVNNVSLRQLLTPPQFLGRVNATTRLLTLGCRAPAALVAGSMAQLLGVRQTIACATVLGCVLAIVGVFNTKLLAMRKLPA